MTWFLLRTKRIRKITMAVRLKIIAVTNDSISLYVLRSFSFDKMTKINTENVVKFSSGSFCFVFFFGFFRAFIKRAENNLLFFVDAQLVGYRILRKFLREPFFSICGQRSKCTVAPHKCEPHRHCGMTLSPIAEFDLAMNWIMFDEGLICSFTFLPSLNSKEPISIYIWISMLRL